MTLLAAASLCGGLRAHTVPVVVIEGEFSSTRDAVLKVNLDPRLFLSQQPTTVPPVPASWWFEQDDASRQKTLKTAQEYIDHTFAFTVGATSLKADWRIQPIDSASAFPLSRESAEVHLLAEFTGALPGHPGGFKVAIGKDCAVAVILLCSNKGDAERRPQSLFPGETSRTFPLADVAMKAEAIDSSKPQTTSGGGMAPLGWLAKAAGANAGVLALGVLLGITLYRRPARAVTLLLTFHAAEVLAAAAFYTGWLPEGPPWMTFAYWAGIAVGILQLLVFKSSNGSPFVPLAAAGICHGLAAPHPANPAAHLTQNAGALMVELIVLFVCVAGLRLTRGEPPPSQATPA